jgi:hypothetical protein
MWILRVTRICVNNFESLALSEVRLIYRIDVYQAMTVVVVLSNEGKVVFETIVATRECRSCGFCRASSDLCGVTFEETTQATCLCELVWTYVAEVIICKYSSLPRFEAAGLNRRTYLDGLRQKGMLSRRPGLPYIGRTPQTFKPRRILRRRPKPLQLAKAVRTQKMGFTNKDHANLLQLLRNLQFSYIT